MDSVSNVRSFRLAKRLREDVAELLEHFAVSEVLQEMERQKPGYKLVIEEPTLTPPAEEKPCPN